MESGVVISTSGLSKIVKVKLSETAKQPPFKVDVKTNVTDPAVVSAELIKYSVIKSVSDGEKAPEPDVVHIEFSVVSFIFFYFVLKWTVYTKRDVNCSRS